MTVPQGLTNTTVGNAMGILQSAGLQGTAVYKTSTALKGTVLSTDPASGTKVNQGSTVTLTVSAGPADVIVPSLIGQSQGQAGQALGAAQLNLGSITPVPSTQYPAGDVVSSNPAAGTSVPPGSSVAISVSTGPPATTTTTTTTTTVPSSTTTSSTTTTTSSLPKGGGGGGGD